MPKKNCDKIKKSPFTIDELYTEFIQLKSSFAEMNRASYQAMRDKCDKLSDYYRIKEEFNSMVTQIREVRMEMRVIQRNINDFEDKISKKYRLKQE